MRPNEINAPAALLCPVCEKCGLPTRFVGLEAIDDDENADLCTYQCTVCEHVQAQPVMRNPANGHNHAAPLAEAG